MKLCWLWGAVLLLLWFPLSEEAQRVWACGVAAGQNKSVQIANESAIIIWDASTKIEHFIRRASFDTDAPHFGFLVPTPTKPILAEASDEAFTYLAKVTEPEVVTKTIQPIGLRAIACSGEAYRPEVRVLEEKRVAGLDAAILEADKAELLEGWLREHGYVVSPALTEWVKPYVAAGWKMGAFRIATDVAQSQRVGTPALRMTFETSRPFFPYREPEGQSLPQKNTERLLRIFFLSDSRVKGTLGEQGKSWPGKIAWTNPLPEAQREDLLKLLKLPSQTPSSRWWLTEFEDASSPRPAAADVYFSTSEDQTSWKREPHRRYVVSWVPDACATVVFLALLLSFFPLIRLFWKKKAGKGVSGV